VALFAHWAEFSRLPAKRDDAANRHYSFRAGYAGASIEDTVALAMSPCARSWRRLSGSLAAYRHPALYREQLGIVLPEEVLPFSNTVGYLRPGC
jgi:hypothetical protein